MGELPSISYSIKPGNVREIEARSLLSTVKQSDDWFDLKYNMNLYRGCQHRCIYCDSRSECYRIENFDSEILVKVNAIELLERELRRKRVKGRIGTGSMNDPYMPLEAFQRLTRQALEIIAEYRFPVHILTKSDLITRDLDLIQNIAKIGALVSFSITTSDNDLGLILEPGAASVSRRFAAMRTFADAGVETGVLMMPILPFLEDSPENISAIVERSAACGASYILPSFGMTMRDKQREYFYAQLDRLFPGMRGQYERRFGGAYHCPANRAAELDRLFHNLCKKLNLRTWVTPFESKQSLQPALFPLG